MTVYYIRTRVRDLNTIQIREDHFDTDNICSLTMPEEVLKSAVSHFTNAKIANMVYRYLDWLHPYFELSDNHYGLFISTLDVTRRITRLLKVPVFSPNERDIEGYDYINLERTRHEGYFYIHSQNTTLADYRLYGHKLYSQLQG